MKPIRVFNRTLHKKMWQWLADHPTKLKSDWLCIDNQKLTAEEQDILLKYHMCFACYCADYSIGNVDACKICPLDWGTNRSCYKDNNLFTAWVKLSMLSDPHLVSAVAEAIANLPVKEYDDIITIVI